MVKLFAHPSGALYIPEEETALFADLHLGYAWAQRRRGQLGPVADGGAVEKFLATLAELSPKRVVLLGDVYHAPRPSEAERDQVERALDAVRGELVIVRGNHDRALLRDFGKAPVPEWRAGGIVAVHGDRLPETEDFLVMGHLHPVVKVRDAAGASRRVPVFWVKDRQAVLPAFTPFSSGCPVRGGSIVAATGTRVVPLTAPRFDDLLPGLPSLVRIA